MAWRAMVVDDSRAIRTILKKMLLELGFEVIEAGNGREALDKMNENGAVYVALVDWNMPEMNGLEFIQAVRAQERFSRLKIMMVTTEAEADRVMTALSAGANEYLMKPFTKEAVMEKLELLKCTPW